MCWQKKERQQGNQWRRGRERDGGAGWKRKARREIRGKVFKRVMYAVIVFTPSPARLSPPPSKRSGCGLYLPARRNSIWDNLLGSLSPDAPQGHRIERMNVKEDRISKRARTRALAPSAGPGTHNCRRVDFTLVS